MAVSGESISRKNQYWVWPRPVFGLRLSGELVGERIGEPLEKRQVFALEASLLLHLAVDGRGGFFAIVEPALRELPRTMKTGTLEHQHAAVVPSDHRADACAEVLPLDWRWHQALYPRSYRTLVRRALNASATIVATTPTAPADNEQ